MEQGMRTVAGIVLVLLMVATIDLLLPPTVCADTGDSGQIGSCTVFPHSVFYARVDSLPLATDSATKIAYLIQGATGTPVLDTQFSPGNEGGVIGVHKGFEFTYISPTAVATPVPTVTVYPEHPEFSDFGGAPIPTQAKIQGGATNTPTVGAGTPTATYTPTFIPGSPIPFSGGDRHVIVVDPQSCNLYEMYKAYPHVDNKWDAGSTAHWSLSSNAIRPIRTPGRGMSSADASGLPMYPLIPRYSEVVGLYINHAIRVNVRQDKVRCTNNSLNRNTGQSACAGSGFPEGWIWPATYSDGSAPSTATAALPMGSRLRLKNNYPFSCLPTPCPQAQVFVTALKQYGVIIADTWGANETSYNMGLHAEWTPAGGWDLDDKNNLQTIPLSAFEVVDMQPSCGAGSYQWSPNSEMPCYP